jgi:hypothetical protein
MFLNFVVKLYVIDLIITSTLGEVDQHCLRASSQFTILLLLSGVIFSFWVVPVLSTLLATFLKQLELRVTSRLTTVLAVAVCSKMHGGVAELGLNTARFTEIDTVVGLASSVSALAHVVACMPTIAALTIIAMAKLRMAMLVGVGGACLSVCLLFIAIRCQLKASQSQRASARARLELLEALVAKAAGGGLDQINVQHLQGLRSNELKHLRRHWYSAGMVCCLVLLTGKAFVAGMISAVSQANGSRDRASVFVCLVISGNLKSFVDVFVSNLAALLSARQLVERLQHSLSRPEATHLIIQEASVPPALTTSSRSSKYYRRGSSLTDEHLDSLTPPCLNFAWNLEETETHAQDTWLSLMWYCQAGGWSNLVRAVICHFAAVVFMLLADITLVKGLGRYSWTAVLLKGYGSLLLFAFMFWLFGWLSGSRFSLEASFQSHEDAAEALLRSPSDKSFDLSAPSGILIAMSNGLANIDLSLYPRIAMVIGMFSSCLVALFYVHLNLPPGFIVLSAVLSLALARTARGHWRTAAALCRASCRARLAGFSEAAESPAFIFSRFSWRAGKSSSCAFRLVRVVSGTWDEAADLAPVLPLSMSAISSSSSSESESAISAHEDPRRIRTGSSALSFAAAATAGTTASASATFCFAEASSVTNGPASSHKCSCLRHAAIFP